MCMGESNCERYLIDRTLTLYSRSSCHIDESLNDGGEGKCLDISECKGERSCI